MQKIQKSKKSKKFNFILNRNNINEKCYEIFQKISQNNEDNDSDTLSINSIDSQMSMNSQVSSADSETWNKFYASV